jgi:branched-chain amino acid transport system ATP-binding protein
VILKVNGLTKYFGGLAAVKNVDFHIGKGEILGLIGPNGAGKTTVFNLITGSIPLSSGNVIFDNREIGRIPHPHKICKMGIGRTFQKVKPFPSMTVLDNVLAASFCCCSCKSDAKEKAHEVLDFVALSKKKDYLGRQLTIGDRKRLELAKALATNPRLILLDEVMAGLTPTEVNELLIVISRIRNNGVTIFVIEHIMKVIMTLSDRVVVLHHGEKISEGTPEEISRNPRVIEAYLGEETASA